MLRDPTLLWSDRAKLSRGQPAGVRVQTEETQVSYFQLSKVYLSILYENMEKQII